MISKTWQKNYESTAQIDPDSNNSLAKLLKLIGENRNVLEFGCASGYFSRMLSEKGCNVTGIEINSNAAQQAEKYCSRVIVADLDFISLNELLPQQTFDVAVFGDVLEHLRDPWHILETTRKLLNPGGFVVASIPNIAHGAVRLALLQGRFNYQKYGILENTHIRFFTGQTIKELFEKSGYFLDATERTKIPILADFNLLPQFDKNAVDPKLISELEKDEESDTLQFIVRAYPESSQNRYAALLNQNNELVQALAKSKSEIQTIEKSKWWRLRRFIPGFIKH